LSNRRRTARKEIPPARRLLASLNEHERYRGGGGRWPAAVAFVKKEVGESLRIWYYFVIPKI